MNRRRIQALAQHTHPLHRVVKSPHDFIELPGAFGQVHSKELQAQTGGHEQRGHFVMQGAAGGPLFRSRSSQCFC
jgi:hypothetical protein